MQKTTPVKDKLDTQEAYITHLLEGGLTYTKIARQLKLGNEETLRQWIVARPALNALRTANGKYARENANRKERKW